MILVFELKIHNKYKGHALESGRRGGYFGGLDFIINTPRRIVPAKQCILTSKFTRLGGKSRKSRK